MKSSTKSYQEVKTIGLYYLGFLLLTVAIAFALRNGAEYLEAFGFQNMTVISYLMSINLFLCLFINGIGLLGYNTETSDLEENDIAHRARTYYISPFVNLLIGFVAGISIWVILNFLSIIIEEVSDFALVAIFLSIISLRVSSMVEKLIFKDGV